MADRSWMGPGYTRVYEDPETGKVFIETRACGEVIYRAERVPDPQDPRGFTEDVIIDKRRRTET